MTMQVVIFSVMLFGMSGVILDFGRIYDEHSGMQSFTDQAALAAAKELNGQADSLQRAIDAVYDSNGDTLIAKISDHAYAYETNAQGDKVRVEVPYKISGLYFLKSFSDDSGDKQYSLGDNLRGGNLLYTATPHADDRTVGSEHATASFEAKYVVAIAEEISVRNSLMQILNIGSSGDSTTAAKSVEADQKLRTVSVAKNKRVSCGDFSNLVICNPWEGRTRTMNEALSDQSNVGIQFHFRADGLQAQDGSPTAVNSLLRRLSLEGASGVKNICSNPLTVPGFDPSLSASELEMLTTICMMSAAVTPENGICVDEELRVTAAEPEVVTTSLNTVFDMWDWPISEVLTWDEDASGNHSQQRDQDDVNIHDAGSQHILRDSSMFFQPALNIMKGRTWRQDLAETTNSALPRSSRLNYPRSASTGYFELILNRCIRQGHAAYGTQCLEDVDGNEFAFIDTDSQPRAYISQPTNWPDVYEYYFTNFDAHFQGSGYTAPDTSTVQTYAQASEVETAEWLHNNGGTFFAYGTSVFTYEQGDSLTHSGEDASLDTHLAAPNQTIEQIEVQRCRGDVLGNGDVRLTEIHPTSGHCSPGQNESSDDETVLARDTADRERAYSNYTYQHPTNPAYSNDRRFLNVTVVNCGSVGLNDNGQSVMDVEGFAQMYLLSPPRVTCPDGSENCTNDQISYADVYGEFTRLVDTVDDSFAVLVR